MPHRLSRFRWQARRRMRAGTAWMQHNGLWVLGAMAGIDLGLHLLAGVRPIEAVYEVIRTIVLDGEASLWDHAQTAAWLRSSLWGMRFLLPAMAGGAVLDLLSRMLPEPLAAPRWMSGHTIVVGVGRLGYRVALELAARGEPVVVVNLNEEGDGLRRLREQEAITALIGDAREPQMLERAGVQRASRVVALTGSDVVNLSVALLALDPHAGNPDLRAFAHVFDPRLGDLPEHLAARSQGAPRLGTFSLYREAAAHFAADRCARDRSEVGVVAGYGRFGRAMVEVLRARRGPEWPIVVIDRSPEPDELPAGVAYLCGDLLSARTLDRIRPQLGQAASVLCIVCTDSDAANLAFALRLRQGLSGAEVTVFTRLFEWPHSMQGTAGLDGLHALELWDEAGAAVVSRLLAE